MRLGCGCLIGVIVVVAVLVGLGWAVFNVIQTPDLRPATVTAADSQRAQEKIYSIVSRNAPRGSTVTLTEPEINAFLTRNLGDLAIADLRVALLTAGTARLTGRTSLGAVLAEPPLSVVRDALPSGWLARPVWLEIETAPRVEVADGRRFLRLDVRAFRVGRQPLPATLVRLILDPATARVLKVVLPEHVDSVRVDPGRAVIRIAS